MKTAAIADADKHNAELLSQLLKIFGYDSVTVYPDGNTALAEIAKNKPDLLIVDANLQGVDGLLLLEIIRKISRFRGVCTILMGVASAGEIIEKANTLGVGGYLEKPVSAENLKRVLQMFTGFIPTLTSELEPVVRRTIDQLIDATRHTLGILFGQAVRITKIDKDLDYFKEKSWDYVADAQMQDARHMHVEIGISREFGDGICQALGLKRENNEMVVQGIKNIAMLLTNRFISRDDGEKWSRTSLDVLQNAKIDISNQQEPCYVIHARVAQEGPILRKQFHVPIVVQLGL